MQNTPTKCFRVRPERQVKETLSIKAVGGDVGKGNKVTVTGTGSCCHCSSVSKLFSSTSQPTLRNARVSLGNKMSSDIYGRILQTEITLVKNFRQNKLTKYFKIWIC